jgi:hypothetical protein
VNHVSEVYRIEVLQEQNVCVMKLNGSLSNEEYVQMLEEQRFDEILSDCQDYIKQKVDVYLQNFKYYSQFSKDFYHEVYIHISTKSLRSEAFLNACKNGNSFKFYLAKTIRNHLNTLLSKEKNKRDMVVAIDHIYAHQDDEFDPEKSGYFADHSNPENTDSLDILNHLKSKFEKFIHNFLLTFPKIAYKLILLLKLQARVKVNEQDLRNCFVNMKKKDVRQFLEALELESNYVHKEDKDIYGIIHPFFQTYRQEKGSPAALQRWLNQYITGDKYSQGIIDFLTIKESDNLYKITDKKLFSDFLHLYFKSKMQEQETIAIYEVSKEPLPISTELQPIWELKRAGM